MRAGAAHTTEHGIFIFITDPKMVLNESSELFNAVMSEDGELVAIVTRSMWRGTLSVSFWDAETELSLESNLCDIKTFEKALDKAEKALGLDDTDNTIWLPVP